jgi:hypothetical protein
MSMASPVLYFLPVDEVLQTAKTSQPGQDVSVALQVPIVVPPSVMKAPNAREWYRIGDLEVCRQCYAFKATRSCCPVNVAHKTLCAQCTATKCDICGAVLDSQ